MCLFVPIGESKLPHRRTTDRCFIQSAFGEKGDLGLSWLNHTEYDGVEKSRKP